MQLQASLALISNWMRSQVPLVGWSLNPFPMNETQNSVPCVDTSCENDVGMARQNEKRMRKKILNRFMKTDVCLVVFSPLHAGSLKLLLQRQHEGDGGIGIGGEAQMVELVQEVDFGEGLQGVHVG